MRLLRHHDIHFLLLLIEYYYYYYIVCSTTCTRMMMMKNYFLIHIFFFCLLCTKNRDCEKELDMIIKVKERNKKGRLIMALCVGERLRDLFSPLNNIILQVSDLECACIKMGRVKQR